MKHLLIASTLALSVSSFACGGAAIPPPSHAQVESAREELSRYRGALAQIKANPHAKSAASDIDRAEEWLDVAKQIAADNGSSARLRLYLDAVHAQLVMVQSHYAREEARKSAGMKDQEPPAEGGPSDDEELRPPSPRPQASRGPARAELNDSTGDDL